VVISSILRPLSEAKTGLRISGGAAQTARYHRRS
jgi:hypothetical protein